MWFTCASIFCLPSEKIQQSRHRLSDERKTDPEDDIPGGEPTHSLDLCQGICQEDKWKLEHHARESDTYNLISM